MPCSTARGTSLPACPPTWFTRWCTSGAGGDAPSTLVRAAGVDDHARTQLDAAFRNALPELARAGAPVPVSADLSFVGTFWPEPVSHVFVAPIALGGSNRPSGYVLCGLSPRLPFDHAYREHLCQLAAQVALARSRVEALHLRDVIEARDRCLVELDDAVRPLSDAEEITFTAARKLGQHLRVNRCAYATVEDDVDTFVLTGNYNDGVQSIVGRYTFRQFGEGMPSPDAGRGAVRRHGQRHRSTNHGR